MYESFNPNQRNTFYNQLNSTRIQKRRYNIYIYGMYICMYIYILYVNFQALVRLWLGGFFSAFGRLKEGYICTAATAGADVVVVHVVLLRLCLHASAT